MNLTSGFFSKLWSFFELGKYSFGEKNGKGNHYLEVRAN